jgi:hypothetical protein
MTKRIAIAVTTAAAFLFSFSAGHSATAPVHSVTAAGPVADGCPAPMTMHPDGTCWP